MTPFCNPDQTNLSYPKLSQWYRRNGTIKYSPMSIILHPKTRVIGRTSLNLWCHTNKKLHFVNHHSHFRSIRLSKISWYNANPLNNWDTKNLIAYWDRQLHARLHNETMTKSLTDFGYSSYLPNRSNPLVTKFPYSKLTLKSWPCQTPLGTTLCDCITNRASLKLA